MNNHSLVFEKGMTANKVILILGILFVSFNLRPAITAVGPVVSAIRLIFILQMDKLVSLRLCRFFLLRCFLLLLLSWDTDLEVKP